jgi:hypothetical protein
VSSKEAIIISKLHSTFYVCVRRYVFSKARIGIAAALSKYEEMGFCVKKFQIYCRVPYALKFQFSLLNKHLK